MFHFCDKEVRVDWGLLRGGRYTVMVLSYFPILGGREERK